DNADVFENNTNVPADNINVSTDNTDISANDTEIFADDTEGSEDGIERSEDNNENLPQVVFFRAFRSTKKHGGPQFYHLENSENRNITAVIERYVDAFMSGWNAGVLLRVIAPY
ncbi:hypothetical protein E4U40_002875, partial [Claviceps sp. LM458 group G5]